MWVELIKKIELQSILVLLLTLFFGYLLLSEANEFATPRGILGTISISVGLLYTIISFFSNNIRESYKDVILEYKSTISALRLANKDITQAWKDKDNQSSERPTKRIGDYSVMTTEEVGTEDK